MLKSLTVLNSIYLKLFHLHILMPVRLLMESMLLQKEKLKR